MANANPSRAGQINLSGDPKALFLKVWSGEVITAFEENNVAYARSMTRTITSGKSAQFPVFGKGTAEYHTPGTEILGDLVGSNEKIITIDDKLIAPRFVPDVDEAMSHFDIRGPYTEDAGRALAAQMDSNIFRVGYVNARSGATVTGGFGGSTVTAANVDTDVPTFIAAAFAAAKAMSKKDVPRTDRYLFVNWDMYFALTNSGDKSMSKDFNAESNGSVAMATIYWLAGFMVVPTNNLPNTNITSGPYQGNFTKSVALAQHKTAVGTVKLIDLKTESAYDIRRQGTLIVSKYMVGHGGLRPEASVEIALP